MPISNKETNNQAKFQTAVRAVKKPNRRGDPEKHWGLTLDEVATEGLSEMLEVRSEDFWGGGGGEVRGERARKRDRDRDRNRERDYKRK